jgi:hypothetical protein
MWALELFTAAGKELSGLPDDVQADFLSVGELLDPSSIRSAQ